ncbi:MAG: hypothetical protein WA655_24540 [Candidatus Korobacteraceae bacterium]
MLSTLGPLQPVTPMRRDPTAVKRKSRPTFRPMFSQICFILLAAVFGLSTPLPKNKADETPKMMVRIEAPAADVMKAVEEVTQDQIIHGTYSYEKERILYGAHSANTAHAFGVWRGSGTVFYKVAGNVLSPRYFKDTEDIGTISIRYVVEDAGPNAATLQIDAIFVDARNVHHASEGNVESSEYAAIQEHLRTIQAKRRQALDGTATVAASAPQPAPATSSGSWRAEANSSAPAAAQTVPELQKEIDSLRHQVELRVGEQGAQLKAAPFHSAATLESVPAEAQVLIVIVSPYWYGVETEDGHRGWIHHSQLESLP